MPNEAGPLNITPKGKSLESTKETFKKRLEGILNEQLTVENIEHFATDALNKTIKLADDVLKDHKGNPSLSKKEQEDEAFKALELPNIQDILQSIIEVRDKIATLRKYLETNIEFSDKVITPPQENNKVILPGKGNFEKEKKLFPRLLTLMYILEHDFDMLKEEVKIIEGEVTPEMMRQTSYVRVEIPELKRTVYLCDEEGNASYIFDDVLLAENKLSVEEIDLYDKEEKNSLIANCPGIGMRLIQSKHWRNNMTSLLEEIPKTSAQAEEVLKEKTEIKSEFKKKVEFLPFDKFQEEVRILYDGTANVQKWYFKEKKNHPDWPSTPINTYSKKNWVGWSEIVGKENPKKKEFLTFDKFCEEVRALYPGKGDVQKWYHQEVKNHLNWPANAPKAYKKKGWVGWAKLAGRESLLEKKFLPFDKFQGEVRALYPGKGDVFRWFNKERKNHPNWPSNPKKTYKESGWIDWSNLGGIENQLKKKYPLFDKFQEEVRALYPGAGGVWTWYHLERKNHFNWPSHPYKTYHGKGWEGWEGLVGKK